MRRREFIAGLGATTSLSTWPLAMRAQQQTRLTVGWLEAASTAREAVEGFRRGLAEVGFSEGRE